MALDINGYNAVFKKFTDFAQAKVDAGQTKAIADAHFEMLANAAGIATCWCGFLKMVQQEVPELLEQTIGLRRTTPFYAMLFGRPAVRYARSVQRDSYARIDFR